MKKRVKKENKSLDKKNKISRISTGIEGFNDLIEGGLEINSTNIVIGGPGSGKTIFATEFLVCGLKNNEKCLYVTFEEKKDQFYKNMKEFGWDLQEYENNGLFTFLEYTPSKVKTMLEEGGGSIESIIVSRKISRIVIDSITSFALLFEDELAKREAALSLFNMIKKWNCTSLLTVEDDQENSSSSKSVEFESDAIIILYFTRVKDTRQRYVEILKMRGTKHSEKIHKFEITKKGIKIDKRPANIST